MRPEREEFSGIWIYICDQSDEKVGNERAIALKKTTNPDPYPWPKQLRSKYKGTSTTNAKNTTKNENMLLD